MSAPRVAFASFPGVAGHLGRLLAVAEATREHAPVDITIVGSGGFASETRAAGFTPIDTPERPLDLFEIRDRDLAVRMLRTWFRLTLADDLACLRKLAPDCLVVDSRWPTTVAAQVLGIPTIGITNAIWTHQRAQLALANEDQFAQYDALFQDAIDPVLAAVGHAGATLEQLHEAGRTHIADLPALLECQLDDAASVGPIVWHPQAAPVVDWPAGNGPRVYATAGSTGASPLIEAAAEQLAAAGALVVCTGSADDSVATNLLRTRFCDAHRLLATADVALSHGGIGSVYQALAAGVPVVACPANLDQVAHGELLGRSGAGRSTRHASTARAVEEVERVLADPTNRAQAQTMRDGIATSTAASSIARLILDELGVRP